MPTSSPRIVPVLAFSRMDLTLRRYTRIFEKIASNDAGEAKGKK